MENQSDKINSQLTGYKEWIHFMIRFKMLGIEFTAGRSEHIGNNFSSVRIFFL